MKSLNIAIVGASGLVGEKIIQVMHEENLLKGVNLTLYTSEKSAGKVFYFKGREYVFTLLSKENINKKFDIVFFSAGDEVSKVWVKEFENRGAFVIDNTNAFRRELTIPLVVPEINSEKITKNTKIISNPNCSTIQLAIVINELLKFGNIEKIVVSTYQSVSGAGKNALLDLKNNTCKAIPERICGNVIPKIGRIEENDFCTEENKIMFELCKILGKNISVCASTVRVPIPYCHTESVYVKFKNKVNVEEIKNKIQTEFLNYEELSLPSKIQNLNTVSVSRLRQFSKNEIAFFVVADNLRRGASYNAVMIAKHLIYNFFSKK